MAVVQEPTPAEEFAQDHDHGVKTPVPVVDSVSGNIRSVDNAVDSTIGRTQYVPFGKYFLLGDKSGNYVEWDGQTLSVVGGFTVSDGAITTVKIADGAVVASKMSVTELSAITANMGTLTSGEIVGGIFKTNDTTAHRIEIIGNSINIYDDANNLAGSIAGDQTVGGVTTSGDFTAVNTGLLFLNDVGFGSATLTRPGVSQDGTNTNVSARVGGGTGGEVLLIPADGATDAINNRVRVYERLNLENRGADPTNLVTGDLWVKGGKLYIYNGATSVVVGTQT